MRARRNLPGSYRTHKRSFYTETEFLKFAGTRSQENLIDLVHTMPGNVADMISIDFEMVKEPEQPPQAKAASAS